MRRTGLLSRLILPALLAAAGLLPSLAADGGPLPHRDDLSPADRARVARVLAPPTDFTAPEPFEAMPGGATTVRIRRGAEAFTQPAANLPAADLERFAVGNGLFRKLWIAAPSSTQASDGLGPLYNARSCRECHVNDGRGHGAGGTGFVLRLGERGADGIVRPHPVLGRQLQDRAAPGVASEGTTVVFHDDYTASAPIRASDAPAGSESPLLGRPRYAVALPAGDGARRLQGDRIVDERLVVSPRVAQPMIGLGLLQAIDPADILANADPDDANGDGISGRPHWIDRDGTRTLGRFGWKAAEPSLKTQTAQALASDMGLSTTLHPAPAGDCTAAQPECLSSPHGVQPRLGPVEVPDPLLDLLVLYAASLAPPVRPGAGDRQVLEGKEIFHASGCAACHVPKFVTRRDAPFAHTAFQLVWPYSDLLLHDMGDALADDLPDGDASGREWRTPPLWGIGATALVTGRTEFLHDGRARSLLEAVLWHGGEAAASREAVVALDDGQRKALIAFLNSL